MDLREVVRYGDVCVDVGANVGTLVTQLRDAGAAAVWAIEPDPRCYEDLRRLVGADHLLAVALGDQVGMTTLYRSRLAAHNSCWAANILESSTDWPPLTVPVTTLDALQATGQLPPQIDVVKVDAQGAELHILRGAERLIATQHPRWCLEFWPQGLERAGSSVPAIVAFLADRGYVPINKGSWAQVETYCATVTGHGSIDILVKAA